MVAVHAGRRYLPGRGELPADIDSRVCVGVHILPHVHMGAAGDIESGLHDKRVLLLCAASVQYKHALRGRTDELEPCPTLYMLALLVLPTVLIMWAFVRAAKRRVLDA